jgi:hypothetical protein
MQIDAKIVNSKIWNSLLKTFEKRTIYHLLLDEWYKCGIIEEKPYYLVYETPSMAVGIPLIKQKRFIFSSMYSGAPLIHWLGFSFSTHISDDRNRIDLLTSIGSDLKNRFLYISITNPLYVNDIRPFLWLNFKCHVNYEYTFIGLDEVQKRSQKYKKSLRWAIKYAEKNSVTVKEVSIGYDLEKWLFERKRELSYGKQRFEISNLTKVIHLLRGLEDLKVIKIYLSLLPDGQIASVEVFIVDEKFAEAYRFLAFTSQIGRKTQAGSYTLDQALEFLLRKNFSIIHLMGGNIKELSYFLSQFSPQLRSYYTIVASKIMPLNFY